MHAPPSPPAPDTAPLLLLRDIERCAPEALGRGDVLIGGGRILALDTGLNVDSLPCVVLDAAQFDGAALVAVPGLVDSLVHIGGGGGEGGFATRMPALRAEDALAAGVTTLVGALGTDEVTRSHADLLACARALGAHGLSAFALTGSYCVPPLTLTGSVRGDLVLIPDILGVGEVAIADHRGSHPSVDELARIGADARVGGMLAGKAGTVLIHVGDDTEGLALLDAVTARHPLPRSQWLPTHVNRNAPLLEHGLRWAQAGGTVDLTTSTTPALLAAGEVPAAEALLRLRRDGVAASRITLSSDGQASLPHFDATGRLLSVEVAPIASLLACVRSLAHEHGLTLSDALEAATRAPADVWGLAHKGRLAVGSDADVLLLERDTLRLRATIAGGRIYRVE